MKETWRWFGPLDKVKIDDIRQADARGIVTALHHIPAGATWSAEEIEQRVRQVELTSQGRPSGLTWDVAESLPVSEAIKKQQGPWREHITNYKSSLANLASAGIEVVCYNFMPVLDWTRTHLFWRLDNGATCMRFDLIDFAAFDLFILQRKGAEADFTPEVLEAARNRYGAMTDTEKTKLAHNVSCGLPGENGTFSLSDIRNHLEEYSGIDADRLRGNFTDFLEEVAPVAQHLGIRLCCHPDDPPFNLLGLPRVMSTEADCRHMVEAVDIEANGITFCSGSLGARPDNDLPGFIDRLGARIHFLHLRNVSRETRDTFGSFHESGHLTGDIDMVAVLRAALREEARRKISGRADWSIPMRPDHGHDILDDQKREAQPGYPAIGRLKGLAELRGALAALGSEEVGKTR